MTESTLASVPVQRLTVRDALELPALRSGAPEVVTGREHLDRPVRWVHVAEARNIASVVKGGELLITEGRLFTTSDLEQRRLVAELAERRIAGIVLELGSFFASVPRLLIDECRAHGVVLIALHLQVPFIEVTEAIHTTIVNEQVTLLNSGQELQERLTGLVLSGAGLPEVLDELAGVLGNPVVYEREHGGLVYRALHGSTEGDLTAGWESFVRELDTAPSAIQRNLPAITGRAAGRLVTLALQRPFTESDRITLDRGAATVGLIVMRDSHDHEFAERCRRGFLSALLDGQVAPINAESRATAAGFAAPIMMPIAIRTARHHRHRAVGVETQLWQQTWTDVLADLTGRRTAVMIDPRGTAASTLVVLGLEDVGRRATAAANFAALVMKTAERHLGEPNAAVICVGPAVHTWQSAVEGLQTTVDALDGAVHAPPRLWHDALDLDLDRLIWSLRDNPDLERFARLRLDELMNHDRKRGTELVTTLKVLLQQNGQKAETARALHLERQSLYNRVQRIEALLNVDLSDPDTRLGLHLALRVSRMFSDSPIE